MSAAHSAKRLNELAEQVSELEQRIAAKEELFSGLPVPSARSTLHTRRGTLVQRGSTETFINIDPHRRSVYN